VRRLNCSCDPYHEMGLERLWTQNKCCAPQMVQHRARLAHIENGCRLGSHAMAKSLACTSGRSRQGAHHRLFAHIKHPYRNRIVLNRKHPSVVCIQDILCGGTPVDVYMLGASRAWQRHTVRVTNHRVRRLMVCRAGPSHSSLYCSHGAHSSGHKTICMVTIYEQCMPAEPRYGGTDHSAIRKSYAQKGRHSRVLPFSKGKPSRKLKKRSNKFSRNYSCNNFIFTMKSK